MTTVVPGRDFILALACPDRPGIVHAVSGYLVEQGANIRESQQFEDELSGRFFMRVMFRADGASVPGLRDAFGSVAQRLGMTWMLHDVGTPTRVLVMVSRFGHCLNDLLYRWTVRSLNIDIVAIGSNHRDAEAVAGWHGIPFHHIPITAATKPAAEAELLSLVDRYDVDLVVLARYMQVLSDDLCMALGGRAVNIHHSFLPSFKGARPYHQAHSRGVKLIGATAHYVTPDLDEGPIIEQDVARVHHAYSPEDLVNAGRDVESQVLSRAIKWHSEHRVFLNGPSTVVLR
ncbi:MAG TPA: formyltetrahydrofolate deformylase [Candidatus Lustribacter sp.]|nr:formyltetrahydrofolate deformylase [Candidatus Lustribacter sp.]